MEHLLDLVRDGVWLVATFGYAGIFVAMLVEGSGIPLPFPGAMLLAFVGYTAWRGNINVVDACIAGAAGSTLGAFALYHVSRDAGSQMLARYGRRLDLTTEKLNHAESWFRTHAGRATFFARLTPGVRVYISVAAGLSRMNRGIFLVSTFAGTFLWMGIFIGLGWLLGEGWHSVADILGIAQTMALLAATAIILALVLVTHRGSETRLK